MTMEKFALTLVVLITDVLSLLLFRDNLDDGYNEEDENYHHFSFLQQDESAFSCEGQQTSAVEGVSSPLLSGHKDSFLRANANRRSRVGLVGLVDAKGVAGLGKAGGDSTGGSDKAGQQVPPEVYNALTYAGTAFLFTLSVPLILYGLNKLLNKIEDCFGCGPSSKRASKGDPQKLKANHCRAGPGSAEAVVPELASHNQQFRTNQQQIYSQQQQLSLQQGKQQRQQSPTISASHESLSHHHNLNHYHHRQQQQQQQLQPSPQLTTGPSTVTTMPTSQAITLPFDTELNYKSSPMPQHFQQPYIISSPQI